jgi:hypothetical protein
MLYSQPSMVTVSIKPDSSITSGNVMFRCTINNPTKKNYRYFDFDSNCKTRRYPRFWEIIILKDSIKYKDFSLAYDLINGIVDPDVKLYKNSSRTYDFCLNFNKLCKESELDKLFVEVKNHDLQTVINNHKNELYGNYEVQIVYLKDPFDLKNPLSLISNWTKIEYIHK